jgi:beta-lactamase regulating signal transducer with metallopeptidase domain
METISRYLLTFLLNLLWQAPLVAAVAALASRWMRNGPARHRHAVWVSALVASVLLPLTSVRKTEPPAPIQITVSYKSPALTTAPAAAISSAPAAAHSPSTSNTWAVPFAETTAGTLVGAYLLFMLFRFGRLFWSWRRTVRIRQTATVRSMPAVLQNVWGRCLEALDLHDVELLSSVSLSSPVMTGIRRKTIILPEPLFAETSEDVLTTAIGHEMAHVARNDFGWKLVYELLRAPISFHPAAWIVRREIERTREMACDELVTQRLLDPGVYARSIMRIASAMAGLPNPGCALGVFDGDILEERIRRLMERPIANLRKARLLLVTGLSALALCAVIASSLAFTARAQSGAHGEMKQAGDAYNSADYKSAVQHFENAVKLEPGNINAKLFLANTLIRESFAGGQQSDGTLLTRARQQYQEVLAQDPQNKPATQGMVAVAMHSKQFKEVHDWAVKLIQLDPKDKSAYYTAGVVDWVMVYPEFQQAKQAAGGNVEEYWIPDAASRKSLRDRCLPQIEDGFRMLQIALQLDPNYEDAMAYMNLLDRLKGGIVDNQAESADLIEKADDWVGKTLAAKRRNAETHEAGPAMPLDVDGPPPGPGGAQAIVFAPPPPPPPPPPAPAVSNDQPASATPLPTMRNAAEWAGSFWQVTGEGKMPASELVRLLKDKGFQAVALSSGEDNQVRVMVGPCSDAQCLDRLRTSLERTGLHAITIWENGHY